MDGSVAVAGCILPCELIVLQDAEEWGNDLGPAAENRSTVRFPNRSPASTSRERISSSWFAPTASSRFPDAIETSSFPPERGHP